ncbi:MAG: TRAP transporter small permease subunit [Candidatus Rokubacteria bacterium]|nr:TRAP transporter small permease subunit [Candidatus Rokubacteria bacterium]
MEGPPKAPARAFRVLDGISVWTARFSSWLILPLMLALVYEVVSRKFFYRPTIWASDVSYMLYGTLFMLGAAYTLHRGAHVRTDFFYRLWSPRIQGMVDALLYLLLFFPGIALFLWSGWGFAWDSWVQGERAITSSWRAPIYLLKMVIPIAAGLLLLQGISEFLKSLYAAVRGRWP